MNVRTKLFLATIATLCLAVFSGAAMADCTICGSTQAKACSESGTMYIAGPTLELPSNVAPFSPAANFMSLCGLARWQHAQETGEWLPRPAACPGVTYRTVGATTATTTVTTWTSAKRPVECVDNPFAPEVNFMSGCGYHRWRHYKETGVWLPGSQICRVVHGG